MTAEYLLERTQVVERPLAETFAFFADPWNLEAITPRWLRFRIVDAPQQLQSGSRLRYRLHLFGLPVSWTTEIVEWAPPERFVDLQLSGPYPLWEHTHTLVAVDDATTAIHDRVRYRVPGGAFAPFVNIVVRRWLDGIFAFRARQLRRVFCR